MLTRIFHTGRQDKAGEYSWQWNVCVEMSEFSVNLVQQYTLYHFEPGSRKHHCSDTHIFIIFDHSDVLSSGKWIHRHWIQEVYYARLIFAPSSAFCRPYFLSLERVELARRQQRRIGAR